MEACKLTVENARLNGVSDRLEVLSETWDEGKNYEMFFVRYHRLRDKTKIL